MDEMTISDVRALLMAEGGSPAQQAGSANPTDDATMADGAPGDEAQPAEEGGRVSDGLQVVEGASPQDAAQGQKPEEAADAARFYADGSVGLGIDIVEIARMEAILKRQPGFTKQVFSADERAYCDSKASPATHYALRFAAKEAVVKALGTGFAEGIWVHDIEVERNKKGRPSVKLSGRALEVAKEQGVRDLSLSLSYTRTDAVACALAITESSLRASEKRKDPMEELARQFKETRKMLDEL